MTEGIFNEETAFENIRSYLVEQWNELDEDERPCDDLNDYIIDRLDDVAQELWENRESDQPSQSELSYSAGVHIGEIDPYAEE